jgi:hypothetical protein
MERREYSVRMQKVSGVYLVKADTTMGNITKKLVFQTWDDFLARFKSELDRHDPGWVDELKKQVETLSYGVSVFPNNPAVDEELVRELGFLADEQNSTKDRGA